MYRCRFVHNYGYTFRVFDWFPEESSDWDTHPEALLAKTRSELAVVSINVGEKNRTPPSSTSGLVEPAEGSKDAFVYQTADVTRTDVGRRKGYSKGREVRVHALPNVWSRMLLIPVGLITAVTVFLCYYVHKRQSGSNRYRSASHSLTSL